jgi:hypothetical protein
LARQEAVLIPLSLHKRQVQAVYLIKGFQRVVVDYLGHGGDRHRLALPAYIADLGAPKPLLGFL